MKISILILSLVFALFGNEYQNIAENFLKFKNIEKSVVSSEFLQKDDQNVGYIFRLSDGGYIVTPISKSLSPIQAFSFKDSEIAPPLKSMLSNSLFAHLENNTISDKWDFLLNYKTSSRVLKSYTPNTILLTTTWNQYYPYNSFFPKVGDDNTLTGCVQTAMAQLMNYHKYPSFGTSFIENNMTIANKSGNIDRYENMTAVFSRNYNWEIMSDNYKDFNKSQADEVGYLMKDLAIMNKAKLGVSETGASNNNYALYKNLGYSKNFKSASSSSLSFTELFNIIKAQIDLEQPVLFSLPNHMVVADGYQNDSSGNFVHLNMGWGGLSDSFYNLDEDILKFAQATNNQISISYDIKPCSEDLGDCFVNLEINDSIVNYQNLSLEINDTISDYQNLTLEVNDTISGNSISGHFTGTWETDKFEVYLSGATTIERKNKYYEISIEDLNGTQVVASELDTLDSLSANLVSGKYFIKLYSGGYDSRNYDINWTTDNILDSEKIIIDNSTQLRNISGQVESASDIDNYELYLDGDISIIRSSKYWNIALYKIDGTLIVESLTDNLSANLDSGFYKIKVSKRNSSGSGYADDFYNYFMTLVTTPITEDIPNLNRFQVVGAVENLQDSDEYDIYLGGNVSIVRNSSGYDFSLFDSNGTMLKDAGRGSDNINLYLPLGRYKLVVDFFDANGYYSILNPQYSKYSLTVINEFNISESDKNQIDDNLNHLPEIAMDLQNQIISEPIDILLNVYDKDNDDLNISVFGKNDIIDYSLNKNILTISPISTGGASDIIIRVKSRNVEVEKRFTVLTSGEKIYSGKDFTINGNYLNGSDIYSNKAILDGNCSISGPAFRNVFDSLDMNLSAWQNPTINLTALNQNIYSLQISLDNPSNGYFYNFDENNTDYKIAVICPNSDDNISKIANLLQIDMSESGSFITDSNETNSTDTNLTTSSEINISLSLSTGWNLISNPINQDLNFSTLSNSLNYAFAFNTGAWTLWENGNYTNNNLPRFESFSPKTGYWLNMSNGDSLNLQGEKTICADISGLTSGWYLLGSCESSDINSILSQNENIVILYTFENNQWNAVGQSTAMNNLIQDSGMNLISAILPTQGFWIYIQ